MLFMVVERFRPGGVPAIYQRLKDQGRSLPNGLTYQASWISADLGRCFQVMECSDLALLQEWVLNWGELVISRSCRSCRRRSQIGRAHV